MKKKLFLLFAVLLLSSVVAVAFSDRSFDSSLKKDADTVNDYFHGSGNFADAAAAYDRLYPFFDDSKDFVLNTKTCKFHKKAEKEEDECPGVKTMKEKNRLDVFCTRVLLESLGYDPCDICFPKKEESP